MKIFICANHSYPHCGGTEKVIQQISESMIKFGHSVFVISKTTKKSFLKNNVNYLPCPINFVDFIKLVDTYKPDHLHVYSDYFHHWTDIVKHSVKLKCTKSIALVGMNAMLSGGVFRKFLEKKNEFSVITHSNTYQDYMRCKEVGIPVNVIPNGVDLNEFIQTINFREKYNLKDKNIILCVSNFFPGKGQEHLLKVLDKLNKNRDDFVSVFISTTVNFFLAQILSNKCQNELQKLKIPHRFLTNIPREDTISAFLSSNIFAFPSQIEVAPLVVIESMASKLPWIALPVGNVLDLSGGLFVPFNGKDVKGMLQYNDLSYKTFYQHINTLLDNKYVYDTLADEGYDDVVKNYNWENIANLYNEVFSR